MIEFNLVCEKKNFISHISRPMESSEIVRIVPIKNMTQRLRWWLIISVDETTCPLTRSYLKERHLAVANNSVSIRRTIAKVLTETLKQRYRSKTSTPLSNKPTKKIAWQKKFSKNAIRFSRMLKGRERATWDLTCFIGSRLLPSI